MKMQTKPNQTKTMIYDPNTGVPHNLAADYIHHAKDYRRLFPNLIWVINPWTGKPRALMDKKLDAFGYHLWEGSGEAPYVEAITDDPETLDPDGETYALQNPHPLLLKPFTILLISIGFDVFTINGLCKLFKQQGVIIPPNIMEKWLPSMGYEKINSKWLLTVTPVWCRSIYEGYYSSINSKRKLRKTYTMIEKRALASMSVRQKIELDVIGKMILNYTGENRNGDKEAN